MAINYINLFIFLITIIISNITIGQNSIKNMHPVGNYDIVTFTGPNVLNKLVFVQMHDIENSAEICGERTVKSEGGRFVSIKNDANSRNVKIKNSWLDPNRVMKNEYSNLDDISENASDTEIVAKSLLKEIFKTETNYIVALHTNVNGYESRFDGKIGLFKRIFKKYPADEFNSGRYSILHYLKLFDKEPLDPELSSDIYINPIMNNSDFCITTDSLLFKYLLSNKISCVLIDDNFHANPDNTMIMYAKNLKIPYLNIEVKKDKSEEMQRIINLFLEYYKLNY